MSISRRTQRPLDAGEARFRIIFEQSPVSTQVFAPDGRTVTVNPAWEALWGVTLDQIEGYNILEDEQLVVKGIMPYIVRGFAGEAVSIPAIKYEPDWTIPNVSSVPYRWVRASLYPIKDEQGAISEVVLMHEDITERMDAERALRESEQRFRAIFEGAPIGFSLVDQDGCYLAVNPIRQEMLGYSEAELLGRPYWTFTHPEDVEYDQRVNAEARESGQQRFQLEKRFVRKDGSVAWARVTVSMLYDGDGRPAYSISTAEDITQQKKAEEERHRLFELERTTRARVERLAAEQAAILSQIAEGIIIADPEGTVTFMNEAARRIYGLTELAQPTDLYADRSQLLTLDGQPYPPDELPLFRAVHYGETIVNTRWRIRRADGVEIVAEGNAVPVLSPEGSRLGTVLTLRDVTAQHDLDRQKDEFLSSLAHDLRTPLTTLKGRVQMLQRRTNQLAADPEQLRYGLAQIDANTSRLIALISQLLDVANLQIGRQVSLRRDPTDLVYLVRNVAQEHQQVTDIHSISIQAAVPELIGEWDATRLERVLNNLLSNALKYSPTGGEITLAVRPDGYSFALLTVEDHGVGIPTDDLDRIFARFHRGGNVRGRIPGTGIGLAAVREIVEQHGGSVSVESREHRGTTFSVRLPMRAEPEVEGV